MRGLWIQSLAVLIVAFQAQAADDTLPGVPISQEHHHRQVLENSFVKAYEVEVAPHESTLMHQHLHDYLYIVFGDDDITNAVAGKPEVKLKQPDLTVNFSQGPFAHIAINNADTPFRNITIELLRPQGKVKKFYPSIGAALSGGKEGLKDGREVSLLETEEVRVVAVSMAAKSKRVLPRDARHRLVVMTDKIHGTSGEKEKNSPFPAGMVKWVSAGESWSVAGSSGQQSRLVVLEFKDTATK
jgi:hypothetical protein